MRLRNCLILLFLLLSVLAMAESVTCPIDDSPAYFTGETQTAQNGKQMWLYRCVMYRHEFWVIK
jgi:hypothetical protein